MVRRGVMENDERPLLQPRPEPTELVKAQIGLRIKERHVVNAVWSEVHARGEPGIDDRTEAISRDVLKLDLVYVGINLERRQLAKPVCDKPSADRARRQAEPGPRLDHVARLDQPRQHK